MSDPVYSDTITLTTPIRRGDTTIPALRLRKPNAGEMRGLSLTDLTNCEVGAVLTLLPRISEPPLLKPECETLDPVDLMEVAGQVRLFLMSSEQRALVEAQLNA